MTYDAINPNHYKGGRKFEPIEVIEDWGLNYHLGNALKYISRNGRKPGEDPREGLSKAIWYLERLHDEYTEAARTTSSASDDTVKMTFDQEEADFLAMGEIPSTVLFGSDEYPDMIQAAQPVPFEATYEDILEFESWDPSLGPIEPDVDDQELDHWGRDTFQTFGKDLSQFKDDEIVHQSYGAGYIFGHQKNGDVRILGKHGAPVTTFDGDNAPSEHESPIHDC